MYAYEVTAGKLLVAFLMHNIIYKLLGALPGFCTTNELAGTEATVCHVTLCIVEVFDDMECSTSFILVD